MHTRDRDVPLQTGDPPFILLFVRRLQVTHLGGSNTLEMIEPVLRAIVFEPPAKIAKIVRFRYCIGSRNFLSDFIKVRKSTASIISVLELKIPTVFQF